MSGKISVGDLVATFNHNTTNEDEDKIGYISDITMLVQYIPLDKRFDLSDHFTSPKSVKKNHRHYKYTIDWGTHSYCVFYTDALQLIRHYKRWAKWNGAENKKN